MLIPIPILQIDEDKYRVIGEDLLYHAAKLAQEKEIAIKGQRNFDRSAVTEKVPTLEYTKGNRLSTTPILDKELGLEGKSQQKIREIMAEFHKQQLDLFKELR